MNKALLTGGTGVVGRLVAPMLHERGYEVHAVSRQGQGPHPELGRWHSLDLLDAEATRGLIEMIRPTHLLHLAWHSNDQANIDVPEHLAWFEAGLALLKAFTENGGRRAVLAGTAREYDWSKGGLFSEAESPLLPTNLYGASKRALNLAASVIWADVLSLAWVRLFFIYGPADSPQRLVSSVVKSLLSGEEAHTSEGSQRRDYLYSGDAASALAAVLDSELEGPINIGSGEGLAVKDLVAAIASHIGRPELVRLGAVPSRTDEPESVIADVGRLRDELGWSPSFSLEEGVEETVAWWRRNL